MRTEPVQEVAAEPDTIARFKTALSPYTKPAQATPEILHAAATMGWPLVADPALMPGIVHFRPITRAAPDQPQEES